MSTNNQSPVPLTEQEVAIIARYAGLTISEERLPMIARELNIARLAADDLLHVPAADVTGVAGQFDSAWPAPPSRGGKRGVS